VPAGCRYSVGVPLGLSVSVSMVILEKSLSDIVTLHRSLLIIYAAGLNGGADISEIIDE